MIADGGLDWVEVVPGRDYMITRRCSERRFFLRPDLATNNAFIYSLALAIRRSKVEVIFWHHVPPRPAAIPSVRITR